MRVQDPSDENQWKPFERRIQVIKLQATFTPDMSKVDHANYIFEDDPALRSFYLSFDGKCCYLSPEERVEVKELVRQMVCADEVGANMNKEVDDAKELVTKVHEFTAYREHFVSKYMLTQVTQIPGSKQDTGTELKPSRLDNFKKVVVAYPYSFHFDVAKQGFDRLILDVAKYTNLVTKYGNDAPCGHVDAFPPVFVTKQQLQHLCDVDVIDEFGLRFETRILCTQMADDEIVKEYVEVAYNVSSVRGALQGKPNTPEIMRVPQYLQRLRVYGYNNEHGFPGATLLDITYVRKCGRRYAIGPSLQYVPKAYRSMFCKDAALDMDFVCSLPNVAAHIAHKHGFVDKLDLLHRLRKYPHVWRSFLSEFDDADMDQATAMPYRCIVGGQPVDGNPLLWTAKKEIDMFTALVLQIPVYVFVNDRYGEKRNLAASRLVHVLFAEEDKLLSEMLTWLTDACPNVHVSTLMFDGAIVYPTIEQSKEGLQAMLEDYSQSFPVPVVIKAWPLVPPA